VTSLSRRPVLVRPTVRPTYPASVRVVVTTVVIDHIAGPPRLMLMLTVTVTLTLTACTSERGKRVEGGVPRILPVVETARLGAGGSGDRPSPTLALTPYNEAQDPQGTACPSSGVEKTVAPASPGNSGLFAPTDLGGKGGGS
jgi:hypothetical protein